MFAVICAREACAIVLVDEDRLANDGSVLATPESKVRLGTRKHSAEWGSSAAAKKSLQENSNPRIVDTAAGRRCPQLLPSLRPRLGGPIHGRKLGAEGPEGGHFITSGDD